MTPSLPKSVEANIAGWLSRLPDPRQAFPILAIAGESGSGKTTLALAVQAYWAEQGFIAPVIHQDDYFLLPPAQNHAARQKNLAQVGPGEVRLGWLDEHLQIIQSKVMPEIVLPHMNWETDEEEQIVLSLSGVQAVIVEGTYTNLLRLPNYRIFIDTTYQQTRANRIRRQREEVTPFIEDVLARESSIIRTQRASANLILDHQFNPIADLGHTV